MMYIATVILSWFNKEENCDEHLEDIIAVSQDIDKLKQACQDSMSLEILLGWEDLAGYGVDMWQSTPITMSDAIGNTKYQYFIHDVEYLE